jgi:hypothetical protein
MPLLMHFRYTFGSNTHGQLGRPTPPESPAEKPTAVAALRGRKVTHIASGDYFTVALVESGPEGLEVRTCACACPRASVFSRCCHQTPTTLRDKQHDFGQASSNSAELSQHHLVCPTCLLCRYGAGARQQRGDWQGVPARAAGCSRQLGFRQSKRVFASVRVAAEAEAAVATLAAR